MDRRRAAIVLAALWGLVTGVALWLRRRQRHRLVLSAPRPWEGGTPVREPVAPAVAPATAAPAARPEPDDLRRIRGIGPAMEKLLREHGVTRFEHLAALDDAGVAALEAKLGAFAGRIRRDDWVGQATLLRSQRDTQHT